MPLLALASPRVALAVGAAAIIADPGSALRVLRRNPTGDAAPTAIITVTFDRPVAGSLDRTVDPSKLFTIVPALVGTADWRDPVTLRFRPAQPLEPNRSYTVTVSDRFEAMDGSRLDAPYTFDFRVRGPRVLAGSPVGPHRAERFLAPDARFDLVTDAPVDPKAVETSLSIAFNTVCRDRGPIKLRVERQRSITSDDPWDFREAGGWDRDRSADPLRRVVRLAPERPLPRGCSGWLLVPASLDDRGIAQVQRWPLATYGDFTLAPPTCNWKAKFCPTGPVIARFTTPVKGADVQRHLRLVPETKFTVSDTSDIRAEWALEAALKPRTAYALIADTTLTDAFGQRLTGNPAVGLRTTGYAPAIDYASGTALVERNGARTFGIMLVNVDTLDVVIAPIPDSLERQFLASREWRWNELWPKILPGAERRRIAVRGKPDRLWVYGLKLPTSTYKSRGTPTLFALQVTSRSLDSVSRRHRPIALVQVTDVAAHARVGTNDAAIWVTGAHDGKPRAGAAVTLHDAKGTVLAQGTTDTAGLVRFNGFASRQARPGEQSDTNAYDMGPYADFEGYVSVVHQGDRALLGINQYDPDLSPWRFNVTPAWGGQRYPVAAAVFTERGIYRPGEAVYAKAIVRAGLLGALERPAPGDSLRWLFKDRENESGEAGTFRDTIVALSAFGTADQRLTLPATASLGQYQVVAQLKREGRWIDIASTSYRIAEYRPPEFLVDLTADTGARFGGDSLNATVDARYLFGAPMGRAAVRWTLRQQSMSPWALEIPALSGYAVGDNGFSDDEMSGFAPVQVVASGTDTLDAAGRLALRLKLGEPARGRPARATVEATVTDVNRQTVSAATSVVVHPAAFYIGARSMGRNYFWTAGQPESVSVIAVRPDGKRVNGVKVEGTVIRREWHQVRRERGGYAELVGEWVSDTVARCALTTAADVRVCRFTPKLGGSYIVRFRAVDSAGREVVTSLFAWAMGSNWVPWNDESQLKMDVVPDRSRYSVGDTATVLFASPFTNAEAWVTVEREGLIQQRRLRITSGTTTLRFPITEAFAPNAFVSIVVARGRSAKAGTLDDPGRPAIRVGYAELRVTPERKRLSVDVAPLVKEYRPGDTARVSVRVRDAGGAGQRSEVTLWAVDEGVLVLTGYATPDPIDLLYQPRGLGMRLASNLTVVAPQIPEGMKARRMPGGGGGEDGADILRSRFQSTAFFLGSVVTGADGRATAAAKLPDNLTTFRVMAVAVTAGDRYGSGQSPLLVTRPLVARPALPRFVRDGDRFTAGVVVNARSGGTPRVTVSAKADGAKLSGKRKQTVQLEAGRGREVRFDVRAGSAERAAFRFDVTSGADSDAVKITLPKQPSYHVQAFTVAGVLRDSALAELRLPADIDPARSRLQLNLGTSPLAVIRGVYQRLEIYPYWCTEQLASAAEPLMALYRARHELGADSLRLGDAKARLQRVATTLSGRQRSDGGIGAWDAEDWTTPWLSARTGLVLLDAKSLGIAVDDSVLARLGRYLKSSLAARTPVMAPVSAWYDDPTVRLSDRVMAVDYLSRLGQRDRAAENELQRLAAQLAWEDRAHLAFVLARGGDTAAARRLLEPMWSAVKVEGRAATLPALARRAFYFDSRVRPAAWLLRATVLVDPAHPLVGPLVERIVTQQREPAWTWNTQDYGAAVTALAEFQRRQRAAAARGLLVRAGDRVIWRHSAGVAADSGVSLDGLLARDKSGASLKLDLRATSPGVPMFYYATVYAVPREAPVRPEDRGIQVERWYERYDNGAPITSVAEGELVRVRLRIRVPSQRDFVILDDPIPAGLEAVDLSLRTVGGLPGPGSADSAGREADNELTDDHRWDYGSWDSGWWSPFDHKEMRDDRVVYVATRLWKGTYTATYIARATTPGTFIRPPTHAEEMYNPAVYGESDGGVFTVTKHAKP